MMPVYSHNDYESASPFFGALANGYRGVEADVFLVDGVLRVGHDRRQARKGESFEALYLEPLERLLSKCGRVTDYSVPFLLAIEIKERSSATHDSLIALLQRYPAFRERAHPVLGGARPLQVVLVGWHPPSNGRTAAGGAPDDFPVDMQHRLTRSDTAGLGALDPRVRLVSVDYGKTMGRWWTTAGQRRRWMAALRGVKTAAPGRILRVHNVPQDGRIYDALLAAGVDVIGIKPRIRMDPEWIWHDPRLPKLHEP
ncbi:MAG: hypothetical protein V4617_03855 [Gemmatimonadota bacterium]